ncbi:MAG: MFS transporter [Anaerolineae bacterium]|nr:MFS transporter [Anaerolineae bacterium]
MWYDSCFFVTLDTVMNSPQRRYQYARIAVSLIFLVNGFLVANWFARIADTRLRLGIDERTLGLVLSGLAAGVVFTLPLTGGLVARFGSRRITIVGAIINSLTLIILAVMPTPAAQWIALFIFGMSTVATDIAMNVQGAEVEKRLGYPVMSSLHALFSVGGVLGAGLTSLLTGLNVEILAQFIGVCIVGVLLASLSAFWLLDIESEKDLRENTAAFTLPGRALLPIGAVVFCAAIGEGTAADWSGVYLQDIVGASPEVVPLGYAAFSALMMIGRFSGDWLTARFNRVMLVRAGGAIAALGMFFLLALPMLWSTIVGFAAMGAGLSFIIPLAYSAAGSMPNPGSSLAGVATIGYSAFLAGPPIIGLLAHETSLRTALVLILIMLATLVYSARALRRT